MHEHLGCKEAHQAAGLKEYELLPARPGVEPARIATGKQFGPVTALGVFWAVYLALVAFTLTSAVFIAFVRLFAQL
jgi:hypothetical protein